MDPCSGCLGSGSPSSPTAGHPRGSSRNSSTYHHHPPLLFGSPRVDRCTRGVARFALSDPNPKGFLIRRLRPGPPRCHSPAPRPRGRPPGAARPPQGPPAPHGPCPGAVPRHLPRPSAAAPRGPRPLRFPAPASTMSRRFPAPREAPRAAGPLLGRAPLARPGPLHPGAAPFLSRRARRSRASPGALTGAGAM